MQNNRACKELVNLHLTGSKKISLKTLQSENLLAFKRYYNSRLHWPRVRGGYTHSVALASSACPCTLRTYLRSTASRRSTSGTAPPLFRRASCCGPAISCSARSNTRTHRTWLEILRAQSAWRACNPEEAGSGSGSPWLGASA